MCLKPQTLSDMFLCTQGPRCPGTLIHFPRCSCLVRWRRRGMEPGGPADRQNGVFFFPPTIFLFFPPSLSVSDFNTGASEVPRHASSQHLSSGWWTGFRLSRQFAIFIAFAGSLWNFAYQIWERYLPGWYLSRGSRSAIDSHHDCKCSLEQSRMVSALKGHSEFYMSRLPDCQFCWMTLLFFLKMCFVCATLSYPWLGLNSVSVFSSIVSCFTPSHTCARLMHGH